MIITLPSSLKKWFNVPTTYLVCIFILLSSCAVGPNYTRPPAPLPEHYIATSLGTKTAATPIKFGKAQHLMANKDIPAQWWELFHSKPLNDLIAASLQHNPNVGVAQAALRGSLENVYAQRGSFYPFVGASFSAAPQQTARILQSVLADNKYNFSLYTGQVYAAYTMDLFGGMRRQSESLIAQAEFQTLQLEATYLTLTSNVVYAVIQEAALRGQITATKNIIASQTRILAIFQQQLKFGDVSLSDVATQEAALAIY